MISRTIIDKSGNWKSWNEWDDNWGMDKEIDNVIKNKRDEEMKKE